MPTVLVTGSNRGIGLEFVRQYVAEGWRVIACCRRPDSGTALKVVGGNPRIEGLELADPASIHDLAVRLSGEAIDLLVNNAGVYGPDQTFGKTDYSAFEAVMRSNVLGPLAMVETLLPNLEKGGMKTVVAVSSTWGSIGGNKWGGHYLYGPSKAALNMVVKAQAIDLKDKGITLAAISPGWVRTDMGGEGAPLTAQDSVADMRTRIAELTLADSGSFISHAGGSIPW
jgi:NAD(P)-dependent dehydrogenase (short-subunit alcohol dehydrogenase family)